ncbi:CHAT domain-containing protein [Miltoncostaea marina]|uniref:CHAT domain-containing protein n=1 Tax=Miltoncostaea marina TaxID=2843215 RepID=UPI001C3E0DBE|nr:CHAT domain-containing protein [Miltoncostaea marina]
MELVHLEAVDVVDECHWRWRLTSAQGAFLADHTVALARGSVELEGFTDLYEMLRWRADLQDRLHSEGQLVSRVGRWMGEQVLGAVGDALIVRAPVTVRVAVPEGAPWLWSRPLELAHVGGEPLAVQDVSFVFAHAVASQESGGQFKGAVGERLRMLGLFSLPTGGGALALRHERHRLARMVQEVATSEAKGVELRVVQYGVTRERLEQIVEEGEGWDILHFSGHGLPRGLVLEHEDGSEDLIDVDELIRLLGPTRRQLKLVTLSSCYSAADAATTTLQELGVRIEVAPVPADGPPRTKLRMLK